MPELKQDIIDLRMFELLDQLLADGTIDSKQKFCDTAGLLKQNLNRIKNSDSFHFTVQHIRNVCKEYGVNANYILGFEKKKYRAKQ